MLTPQKLDLQLKVRSRIDFNITEGNPHLTAKSFIQKMLVKMNEVRCTLNNNEEKGYFYAFVSREIGLLLLNNKLIKNNDVLHIPYGWNSLIELGILDYTFKIMIDPTMTNHAIYIGAINYDCNSQIFNGHYLENITGEIIVDNFII